MKSKPRNNTNNATTRHKESLSSYPFLEGGGEMGAMTRSFDWSKTAVGEAEQWPDSLKVALSIILNSSFPMFIWWGREARTHFYNDAYKNILANKHPTALGQDAKRVWSEIWQDVGPLAKRVFDTGESIYMKDLALNVDRGDKSSAAYFTFSYSPLKDESGEVVGIFCAVTETTQQIKDHQLLRESEERFRHLADTAPMYIAMADETGGAVYFNKPWLDFTGKNMDEMKGLGWLSTLHPEDAPQFEKDFTHAFEQRIEVNKEYRFRRADGEYRWMLAIGAPRFTPDGQFKGYFGTYTDFHDLKQAQLAIQQSEDRFRTLIDKSADAVQMVTSDGIILYSSDSIRNVIGYSPEELAHTGVTPYIHPDDIEYFFERFNDLIAHPNKQITMQYRVKHKNGTWAWLETVGVNHLETPNINALVGNFRNITDQKNAEDELVASETRFRALADNIPNLAWMAESDGSIYWYNNRWYEYTGTTEQDMEGWGWQIVHDPTILPLVLKRWKHSIKSGKTFEMVFPLKGKDGIFRPFLTRVVPIKSADGVIEQWIGTNTDISEQIKIKETEARNKELTELSKAKDEFISLASHQLRTPATGVKQYVGMLLGGFAGELTAEQTEFAQYAYDSNEREIVIINDLLSVAQIDAGKMYIKKRQIDFVLCIENILREQSSKFSDKKQNVTFDHKEKSLIAWADEGRIRMVLENLIDNASKYTPPQKKISVSAEITQHNMLKITIKDQGVGIDAADQKKIFEKFVRVDNPLSYVVGGSGLGLYLVKKIVGLHGGTITVKSQTDRGSTFTVILPTDVAVNK